MGELDCFFLSFPSFFLSFFHASRCLAEVLSDCYCRWTLMNDIIFFVTGVFLFLEVCVQDGVSDLI